MGQIKNVVDNGTFMYAKHGKLVEACWMFRGRSRSHILGSVKSRRGTAYYCITFTFTQTLYYWKFQLESFAYSLPLTVCVCLHSIFSGGRRKTFPFLQEGSFSRSRSSKIINIGANRKRVCDFLLVRNSNLSPILHRFGDLPFSKSDTWSDQSAS